MGDHLLGPALALAAMTSLGAGAILAFNLILLGALAAIRFAPGAANLRRAVYAGALAAGHIPTPPSSALLTGARS